MVNTMRIDEVSAGQAITLTANLNNEQISFPSTILEVFPKKKLVLAEPVYREDKVVTFRGNNISVDMLVNRGDDQPVLFKNISIALMKKSDGSLCYNLSSATEGKGINRRQNFRCFIGNAVTMQCGLERMTCNAILRDVSVSGFAVITDPNVSLEKNQIIHVLLEDYIEETKENFSFHLYGLVVRKDEMPKGRVLYGCRLNNQIAGLDTYIMVKQRIALRKSNGSL